MGERGTRRPPGMADVGALAGVSHQTVSRVLNGTGKVAPATRERILEAIEELGYRRNSVARALATNRSRIIGIIATTFVHYGPTSLLVSVEVAARDAGFYTGVTVLEDCGVDSLARALDHFLGLAVEGIIVIAPIAGLPEALVGMRVPVPLIAVTAAELPVQSGVRAVRVDQAGGAALAVRHLLDLGHRDIAHVAGPEHWYEAEAREQGWRGELEAAGLDVREPLGFGWSARTGYEAGLALVASGPPSAVFAANDELALGLFKAFAQAGLAVPTDISVVGFDDEPTSEFFTPGLTTIRQDFSALGRLAIAAALEAIDGGEETAPVVVPSELVVRGSTARRRP